MNEITAQNLKTLYHTRTYEYLTSNISYGIVCMSEYLYYIDFVAKFCFHHSTKKYNIKKAINSFLSKTINDDNIEMSMKITKHKNDPINITIDLTLLV